MMQITIVVWYFKPPSSRNELAMSMIASKKERTKKTLPKNANYRS